MTNLLILAGVPGSGKSTWAKRFFDLKYNIVNPDKIRIKLYGSLRAAHEPSIREQANIRVFDEFHNSIIESLQHNVDVIADATNLNVKARARLSQIAKENGAACHLILFTNAGQAVERNLQRDPDQIVPEQAMEYMFDKYWDTLDRVMHVERDNYDSITKVASVL
jgi:predicted kinase